MKKTVTSKRMSVRSIQIRKPRLAEWKACQTLLPNTRPDSLVRDYRLAVERFGPYIVGVASYRDNGRALEGLSVHVVESRRRQGIGTLLILEVMAEAAKRGRREVMADPDTAAHPAWRALLLRNGFSPVTQHSSQRKRLVYKRST